MLYFVLISSYNDCTFYGQKEECAKKSSRSQRRIYTRGLFLFQKSHKYTDVPQVMEHAKDAKLFYAN